MLKIIAIVIGLGIAAVLITAAFRPNSFRIERRITIKASPEVIKAHIDDFHKWAGWSPWEHIEPDMKRIYEGPQSGTGAVYAWEGTSKAGAGRMEITEDMPLKTVITLDFLKPFKASNIAEFTFEPKGDETVVIWAMYGPSPYISKLMDMIIGMEKMVGPDFEKGLQSLKTVSES